jgi:hypothetical protein
MFRRATITSLYAVQKYPQTSYMCAARTCECSLSQLWRGYRLLGLRPCRVTRFSSLPRVVLQPLVGAERCGPCYLLRVAFHGDFAPPLVIVPSMVSPLTRPL